MAKIIYNSHSNFILNSLHYFSAMVKKTKWQTAYLSHPLTGNKYPMHQPALLRILDNNKWETDYLSHPVNGNKYPTHPPVLLQILDKIMLCLSN